MTNTLENLIRGRRRRPKILNVARLAVIAALLIARGGDVATSSGGWNTTTLTWY